jgi:hypothetical protein
MGLMNRDEIKTALTVIKELREQETRIYKAFEAKKNEVEVVLNQVLEKTKKDFGLNTSLRRLLLMSSSLDSYNLYCLEHEGSTFYRVEEQWVKCYAAPVGRMVHKHQADLSATLDKDFLSNFENFVRTLEERSTLPVGYSDYTWAKPDEIKAPKTVDDLRTIHAGCTILASGKKWHEGWDISDPWAVVKTRQGEVYVYFSTNSHGFGYDSVIIPGESASSFLSFLGGPTGYLTDDVLGLLTV